MFTVLDPGIDCFTTDAAPTTLYTNVPLGIALEFKGCNHAASPASWYQLGYLVTSLMSVTGVELCLFQPSVHYCSFQLSIICPICRPSVGPMN